MSHIDTQQSERCSMSKNPRYYQLRRAIRAVRKVTRGKPSCALRVLNEMRIREYARFFKCGICEFGLFRDPVARSMLRGQR